MVDGVFSGLNDTYLGDENYEALPANQNSGAKSKSCWEAGKSRAKIKSAVMTTSKVARKKLSGREMR